jgi:hypothetical protein
MAIEIKELHIKVKIDEEKNNSLAETTVSNFQLDKLKSELVKECMDKILEKLKEREER